jgi:hypothetical protein
MPHSRDVIAVTPSRDGAARKPAQIVHCGRRVKGRTCIAAPPWFEITPAQAWVAFNGRPKIP